MSLCLNEKLEERGKGEKRRRGGGRREEEEDEEEEDGEVVFILESLTRVGGGLERHPARLNFAATQRDVTGKCLC